MMKNPNSVKCVIVDDEEMAAKVISSHLSHIADFEVVGVYHSAVEAFLFIESEEVDVLFLDIQMPKISGIDMIKMLKKKPLTVLTTAHREYALEGFDLEVIDYLMKPIGLNRFLQTISRLKKQLHPQPIQTVLSVDIDTIGLEETQAIKHVFVKTNRAYQKIDLASVLHIEAIKNHIKIVTETDTHISLIALTEFERQLPSSFIRVHRSFVVNKTNILKFDNYSIDHPLGKIPIGRTYKDVVVKNLKELL